MSEERFIEATYRGWSLRNPQRTLGEDLLGRQAFTDGLRRGIRVNYVDNAVNYSVSEYPVRINSSHNLTLRTRIRVMPQLLDMFHDAELDMNELRSFYRMEKRGASHMVDMIMINRYDSLRRLTHHDNLKYLRATSEANAVRNLNTDPVRDTPTLIQLLES